MKQVLNARRRAYDALLEVERGAYANLALKGALGAGAEPSEQERGFASALFYQTLERLRYLDFIIDHFARGKIQSPVRVILRMGVCQLLYMDVPDSAACNESVKLAQSVGKGGVSGFINGVLRKIAQSRETLPQTQDMGILYSYPGWLVDEYVRRFGSDGARALLSHPAQSDGEICVRACGGGDLSGLNGKVGRFSKNALYCPSLGDITKNPLFEQGKLTVQSESSMLVCEIADPKQGEKVLDACAAPGGKTAYLWQLMGGGDLTAWDKHPHRVKLMQNTLQRLGIQGVKAQEADAGVYDRAHEQAFDLVLTDVPCSGLGVEGKPDVKYSKTPQIVSELAQVQYGILCNCSNYVKRGGRLVYSTCTMMEEENEANIKRFLDTHPDFSLADMAGGFPEFFDKTRLAGTGAQLLPHLDEVDGFFICKMIRA